MNNKARKTMGWTPDSKHRSFSHAKLKKGNAKLLTILTTKPQPDKKQHIYNRRDGWPGLRPLNIAHLRSLHQSAKSIKQISTYEKPVERYNKNIKHFGRVTLMGDTLSLFPSSHQSVRHQSTDKIIKIPKRSSEYRMDRYELKHQPSRNVQGIVDEFSVKERLNSNYKIDFESFNYIDKVIDFEDLWKDYVRKTDRT